MIDASNREAWRISYYNLVYKKNTNHAIANKLFCYFVKDIFSTDILILGLSLVHDLICRSEDEEKDKHHLHQVLSLQEKNWFYAKRSKYEVDAYELKYLDHIVSGNDIRPITDKVETVHSWPVYNKQLYVVVQTTRY
jgi:hypothetical protein